MNCLHCDIVLRLAIVLCFIVVSSDFDIYFDNLVAFHCHFNRRQYLRLLTVTSPSAFQERFYPNVGLKTKVIRLSISFPRVECVSTCVVWPKFRIAVSRNIEFIEFIERSVIISQYLFPTSADGHPKFRLLIMMAGWCLCFCLCFCFCETSSMPKCYNLCPLNFAINVIC